MRTPVRFHHDWTFLLYDDQELAGPHILNTYRNEQSQALWDRLGVCSLYDGEKTSYQLMLRQPGGPKWILIPRGCQVCWSDEGDIVVIALFTTVTGKPYPYASSGYAGGLELVQLINAYGDWCDTHQVEYLEQVQCLQKNNHDYQKPYVLMDPLKTITTVLDLRAAREQQRQRKELLPDISNYQISYAIPLQPSESNNMDTKLPNPFLGRSNINQHTYWGYTGKNGLEIYNDPLNAGRIIKKGQNNDQVVIGMHTGGDPGMIQIPSGTFVVYGDGGQVCVWAIDLHQQPSLLVSTGFSVKEIDGVCDVLKAILEQEGPAYAEKILAMSPLLDFRNPFDAMVHREKIHIFGYTGQNALVLTDSEENMALGNPIKPYVTTHGVSARLFTSDGESCEIPKGALVFLHVELNAVAVFSTDLIGGKRQPVLLSALNAPTDAVAVDRDITSMYLLTPGTPVFEQHIRLVTGITEQQMWDNGSLNPNEIPNQPLSQEALNNIVTSDAGAKQLLFQTQPVKGYDYKMFNVDYTPNPAHLAQEHKLEFKPSTLFHLLHYTTLIYQNAISKYLDDNRLAAADWVQERLRNTNLLGLPRHVDDQADVTHITLIIEQHQPILGGPVLRVTIRYMRNNNHNQTSEYVTLLSLV